MATAWIFEDIKAVSGSLEKVLRFIGFKPEVRESFPASMEAISSVSADDVVCLDSQLPADGTSRITAGLELCAKLRSAGICCGIIWHSPATVPDEILQMGGVNVSTNDELADAVENFRKRTLIDPSDVEQWKQVARDVLDRIAATGVSDVIAGGTISDLCRWLRNWGHDLMRRVVSFKCEAALSHFGDLDLTADQQYMRAKQNLKELTDDYADSIEQYPNEFNNLNAVLRAVRCEVDATFRVSSGHLIVQKIADATTKSERFHQSQATLEQAVAAGDRGDLREALSIIVVDSRECWKSLLDLDKTFRELAKELTM